MQNDLSLAEKVGLGGAGGAYMLVVLLAIVGLAMWALAPFILYGVYHRLGQIRDMMRRGAEIELPRAIAAAASAALIGAAAAASSAPAPIPVYDRGPAFSITAARTSPGERLIMPAEPGRPMLPIFVAAGVLVFVIGTMLYFSLR